MAVPAAVGGDLSVMLASSLLLDCAEIGGSGSGSDSHKNTATGREMNWIATCVLLVDATVT